MKCLDSLEYAGTIAYRTIITIRSNSSRFIFSHNFDLICHSFFTATLFITVYLSKKLNLSRI